MEVRTLTKIIKKEKIKGDLITEEDLVFEKDCWVIGKVEAKSITAKALVVSKSIKADRFIIASEFIKADGFIKASEFIEAGQSIKAGRSIEAGRSIKADGTIEVGEGYKIFAGLSTKENEIEDQQIIARKIKGKIGHGIIEIPDP